MILEHPVLTLALADLIIREKVMIDKHDRRLFVRTGTKLIVFIQSVTGCLKPIAASLA
jgi:hypothetical protein